MPRFRHEVSAYVELFFEDTGEVLRQPPVMRLAVSDVTGLYVDRCLSCHKFICLLSFMGGLLGLCLNRWVQGEGHFLLRVLRGGNH